MPNWLFQIMLVVILVGINPILHSRAVKIHGSAVNLMAVNTIIGILGGIWLFSTKQDLRLMTKYSFFLSLLGGLCSFVAVALLFNVYKTASEDLSLITITASFSIVITAIINHFLGSKMQFHQWIGTVIAFLGIALVNLKR